MTIIETERLVLRHLQWEDLDALAAMMADPEVMRYIGSGATRTRSEVERLLGFWIGDNERQWNLETLDRLPQLRHALDNDAYFGLWGAVEKKSGRLIGRCGLLAWNIDGRHETEVGYLLARKYWGQGLATEAARACRHYGFDRLKFDRLISLIQPANVRSQRVAIKNGMTHERDVEIQKIKAQLYSIERSQRH